MASHSATNATRIRIKTSELTIAADEYGSGPTLIVIHGIGSDASTWWPVIDTLAKDFRTIVIEQRGHGESEKPVSGYLVDDYARDLQGIIAELKLEQPSILGHSLGALTAMRWAASHPNDAQRIVLEDPPLSPNPHAKEMFDEWIENASSSIETVAAKYKAQHPEWSEESCRRRAQMITSTAIPVFTELYEAMSQPGMFDWLNELAAVETPMLLIHGDVESGGAITGADVRRFVEGTKHGQAARIPGAGHGLHRDNTEEFLALAIPFLKGD
jgi:pimeloyl-ACP methyl ester carboxylesterase